VIVIGGSKVGGKGRSEIKLLLKGRYGFKSSLQSLSVFITK
jgi:hypothetical protein